MADTERGSRGEEPNESIYYSFLCPGNRIEEVRDLFKTDQAFGALSAEDNLSDNIRGPFEVTGICLARNSGHILDVLTTRHIAGYSRATPILYPSPEDVEGIRQFRAGIRKYDEEIFRAKRGIE